jgi:hypothetical protein
VIWHPTTFTKNRDQLLNNDVMGLFLETLMGAPEVKPLLKTDSKAHPRDMVRHQLDRGGEHHRQP